MKKLIIILGVVGCSFSAILARFSTLQSTVLVFYRMLFSALFLLPGLIRMRKEMRTLSYKNIGMCICGGIIIGIHFVCYFASLNMTSVASSVVLVDTEVFFVAIGGALFLNETISRTGWICIILTFIGSVVVAMGDAGEGHLLGDIVALIGSVCAAIYTMIGRKIRKDVPNIIYTWIVYLSAAVVVFMISLFSGIKIYPISFQNLMVAVGLCVFCTLLGYSILAWGIKYEKAAFISASKMLEPVFATLLAVVIFKEIPKVTTFFGGIIIIVGIIMFSFQLKSDSE